ncbi:MAG: hypothetical protein NWF01_01300 [Candidatus Bathyarchaeota archaeon]|nr:hypothetical protein [Candidatus Bathyarchaeota archaeon]
MARRQNREDMEKEKTSVSETGRLGSARSSPRVRKLLEEENEHEQ